jgi:hypothetical protein
MPDFVILIVVVNIAMVVALIGAYIDSFGDDPGRTKS